MMPRVAARFLQLSAAGLIALAGFEGYEHYARPPVPGDDETGGFGSTRDLNGQPFKRGQKVDPVVALQLVQRDLNRFEKAIKKCVTVPLYRHEWDAFVTLAYNIGGGAFCKSTLVKVLNKGDYTEACRQILRWNKFKGKPLRGLTIRRKKEYQLCIGKEDTPGPAPVDNTQLPHPGLYS